MTVVTLLEVRVVEPADLDEWFTHWHHRTGRVLVSPFSVRVREEWPDVKAASKVESREIASSLASVRMFGVSRYRLDLYGCEIFGGLTGTCVVDYLVIHFTTPKMHPTFDFIAGTSA